jgi:hypothetical protein
MQSQWPILFLKIKNKLSMKGSFMKKIILSFVFTIATAVYATEVGVKVDKVDASQDTTISIQKGKSATLKKRYEVSTGEHEIAGDKDVVLKDAEKKWSAACKEWKKEFREDNKDNKIVSISCGRMTCSKEGVESTCISNAKYKIKTVIEE